MADISEFPKLKTFDTSKYRVPAQPAPPNYITTLQQQAQRHEEEYKEALNDWRKTYDDLVAEKANLYKADPKYAEAKRKEAAIKTLVSAFGSLADTFAVANGGTAPLRDYRADIYQTQQQADALDKSERAKEADAYQKYLDRLEKLTNSRPKWTKNDAAIKLMGIYADDNRWNLNAELQRELQNRREAEGEKNRIAAKERNEATIAGGLKKTQAQIEAKKNNGATQKESDIIRIPLSNNRQLVLPKGFWNSAALESWLIEIYKDERFSENTRANFRKLLSEVGKIDNKQVQEYELGKLLSNHPELEKIITPYGEVIGGAPADGEKPLVDEMFQ